MLHMHIRIHLLLMDYTHEEKPTFISGQISPTKSPFLPLEVYVQQYIFLDHLDFYN